MKKKFLSAALLTVLTCTFAFADFAVGAEIGFEGELFYKPYLRSFSNATYRSDENPWCFAVNVWPSDSTFVASADNWFINQKIDGNVSWYSFWGISAGIGWDEFSIGTGARIGAGIDWYLLDHKELELYWQLCWNPYLGLEKDDGDWGFMIRPFCFPFATGARWWFR